MPGLGQGFKVQGSWYKSEPQNIEYSAEVITGTKGGIASLNRLSFNKIDRIPQF
jgi:hypothetical protein